MLSEKRALTRLLGKETAKDGISLTSSLVPEVKVKTKAVRVLRIDIRPD